MGVRRASISSSGNLTVAASSGLGFSDLNGLLDLSYYYDSAQVGTACDLILGACGWGTNFDERIENASSGANYTYRDPAGNRYFVSTNSNGQLISDAPVKIDRPRVTLFDENVIPGWITTGSGLPAITTSSAYSGTHSYAFPSTNTAGATTSGTFSNRSTSTSRVIRWPESRWSRQAGGMGVGFNIRDNTTTATRWLVYTFGTDFALPDPSAVKVALGGDPSGWLAEGGSTSAGS